MEVGFTDLLIEQHSWSLVSLLPFL